jgi:hypothetical protein
VSDDPSVALPRLSAQRAAGRTRPWRRAVADRHGAGAAASGAGRRGSGTAALSLMSDALYPLH